MNEINFLNIAQGDDLDGRYLLFYIKDVLYGVSLSLVLEIIQIQKVTHLPCVADYVKGIVNLRGKVIPVVDVRTKLGMPFRDFDEKTSIVVLDIHDMHIGLIVDSVSEVATVEQDNISPPPPNWEGGGEQYLASILQIGSRVVLNIDFEKFFQNDIDLIRIQ